VPIETILAGGVLEIAGTAVPPAGSSAPPPGGYGPPDQPSPRGGILPGMLPDIGIGFGMGAHGGGDRGRKP
jgi:hypothetical protein